MESVGVLGKVMSILNLYADGSVAYQPGDVAERLSLSPATAYRLMKDMALHGLLDREGKKYRLGMSLLMLGTKVAGSLDLTREARPHLAWLREETGENAELHVIRGTSRVPLLVIESSRNLRPMGEIGVTLPIHAGASSHVLLAWADDDQRTQILQESLELHDAGSHFDFERWNNELKNTQEHGWSESTGEREAGISSVAAPIRDASLDVVAAAVVSAPTWRLSKPDTKTAVVRSVVEAAARISRSLGAATSKKDI